MCSVRARRNAALRVENGTRLLLLLLLLTALKLLISLIHFTEKQNRVILLKKLNPTNFLQLLVATRILEAQVAKATFKIHC